MYNEISTETYLKNLEYWLDYIKEYGGLTLCDDYTGQPVQTITADQL